MRTNVVKISRLRQLLLFSLCGGLALSACTLPEEESESVGEKSQAMKASVPKDIGDPVAVGPLPTICAQPMCDPSRNIDQRPSLLLTRSDPNGAKILDIHFALSAVLHQLIIKGGAQQSANELFRRLWDTQNSDAGGTFNEAFQPHCDDNGSTINGFPIDCPRPEGNLTTLNTSSFIPVAVFNRFDLAANDGSHCGEYRIIYAQNDGPSGRNFVIFEGQLPNPNPQCGVDACRPIAEFWANLPNSSVDPVLLGQELEDFYFDGLPGFGPVITPKNYGLGSKGGSYGHSGGQVRTNQFGGSQQWQLREFQLARHCMTIMAPLNELSIADKKIPKPIGKKICKLVFNPVTVKDNPFGELFDGSNTDPRATAFQTAFVSASGGASTVERLAADSLMGIGLGTADAFNGGQSTSQPFFGDPDDYVAQLNNSAPNSFTAAIDTELDNIFGSPSPLTAQNIAARALTQSCAGCHQLSNGADLGAGLTWPASGFFVHVQESGAVSSALSTVFLPHREQVLEAYLQACNITAPPAGGPVAVSQAKAANSSDGSGTLGGSTTH